MTGNKSITTVNAVISKDFADGLYESCKDVEMPSNNQKAIGMLCGHDAQVTCALHSLYSQLRLIRPSQNTDSFSKLSDMMNSQYILT